jgi:uncharacterized delta-60 repeat protein
MVLGLALFAIPTGVALGAAGDLDPSFDGDGKRTIDYGGHDVAYALALRPDGRMLVAGSGNVATDFAVQGLLSDGSDDPSFASQGYLGVGLNGLDHGFAMALQPSDGKIVVVGSTHANPLANGDLAVVRRSPDGSPDMAFAGTGQQIIDYAGGNDQARAVALDRDRRIVIAGFGNTANDVALQRFLPDGTPELSVGFKLDGLDRGQALALQPDGKILIAGSTWPQGGDQDLAILRANPDGGLDTTFAGAGKRTIDYDGFDAAQAIALQPDGRIVIVGYGYPTEDILVDRLLPDGSDDPSFKVEGSPGIDLGGTDDDGNAVALQPDGKILVAGTTYGAGGSDAVILRLQPGGALTPPSTETASRRSTSAGPMAPGRSPYSPTVASSWPATAAPRRTSRSPASRTTSPAAGWETRAKAEAARGQGQACRAARAARRPSWAPPLATVCAAPGAPT